MRHGVQGQSLPSDELHRRVMVELRRRLRAGVPKWYSRDLFWEELKKIRTADSVDNYTDAEYVEALYHLSDKLKTNPKLRNSMQLEPHRGPRGIQDRFATEAAERRDYTGYVQKFKWYHRDRFVEDCKRLTSDSTLQPEDLPERLFLEALEHTNSFLQILPSHRMVGT